MRIEVAPAPVLPGPNAFAAISSGHQWRGKRLHGERLRVFFEAGYGDAFQCARFLSPFVAWADGPVTLVTCPQLGGIFTRSFPDLDVRTAHPLPPARWVVGAWRTGDDPSWFTICAETLRLGPARPPYLAATPRRFARDILHVGLCVRAHADAQGGFDPPRSIADPAILAPWWDVPGIQWHTLLPPGHAPPHPTVVDHGAELADWTDTADLIAGLDLVISVDTAVAHLAGALGVPLWMLLRPACPVGGRTEELLTDVRYGDPRWEPLHCPRGGLVEPGAGCLYPTARLFHQSKPGDWASLVAAVAAALAAIPLRGIS